MAVNSRAVAKALLQQANRQAASQGPGGFGGAVNPAIRTGASPLVASYGEWASGRVQGAGLPRAWDTFMAGSFGPLTPMQPTPIDAPPDGLERPEPRRFQYPVSWNMPHGVPGDEGLKLASFASLRTIADTYSVARACIQLRKAELAGLGWEIVPTKGAEKKMRGNESLRKDFDERRAKIVKFFRRPDPNYRTFGNWFSALLEDVLAVDAMTMYLHPSRKHGKGVLGSDLAALAAIDGTTVRPMLDIHGAAPQPPNPAYQQYLFGVPRTDMMSLLPGADVADLSDGLVRDYRGDQLLYLPLVTRTWTPYGFPPTERALVPILSGIQRQNFQLNFFSEGTIPGLFVSAGDPNATPAQLRALQDALNAMAGDPAWKHKIIVLPNGSKIDPQRPAELAGTFDEIVMTQVCCVPGTEVVTRRGLVPIEQVSVGDLVLTHRGRWRKVTKTMQRAADEDVRRIEAKGFAPLEVTGNHPIWAGEYTQTKTHRQSYATTRWVAARDLLPKRTTGNFDAQTLPIPVVGPADASLRLADHIDAKRWPLREEAGMLVHPHPNVKPLPASVPLGAAFGRLLGLYMAEGSTTNGLVAWYFHEDEVAYQQQVIDDLASLFGLVAKVKPVPGEKCVRVSCQNALLAQLLSFGTARTKCLPSWAWEGNAEFYASLLWGWIAGDGALRPTGWRGATSSRNLAWQMRLVALASGHEPQLRAQPQPRSVLDGRVLSDGTGHIYIVEVVLNKQRRRGTYRVDGPHLTSPIRANDPCAYSGPVHNLEVDEDESYVTTGGTVHNCMSFDVMPMELGISPKTSSSQSSGAANQMAKMSQTVHDRKGNVPLLEFFTALFNVIIQDVLHQEDMRWLWEGLEEGEDEERQTSILVQQINSGLKAIDEGRIELGEQPWGLPLTSDPIMMTQTGPVPLGSIDPATGRPKVDSAVPPPGAPGAPPAGPAGPGGPVPPQPPQGGPPKPQLPNGSGPAGAQQPAAKSPPVTQSAATQQRAADASKTPAHTAAEAAATAKPAKTTTTKGHPHPGQRYTHGWKLIDPAARLDGWRTSSHGRNELGIEETAYSIPIASHRVPGTDGEVDVVHEADRAGNPGTIIGIGTRKQLDDQESGDAPFVALDPEDDTPALADALHGALTGRTTRVPGTDLGHIRVEPADHGHVRLTTIPYGSELDEADYNPRDYLAGVPHEVEDDDGNLIPLSADERMTRAREEAADDRAEALRDIAARPVHTAILGPAQVADLADKLRIPDPVVQKAVRVDVFAGLREIDLLRRRLNKGRSLDGWTPEHLPRGVFEGIVHAADQAAAVAEARVVVKAEGSRQRRDAATQHLHHAVIAGLHELTTGLTTGRIGTAHFVDGGVALMRGAIRAGLAIGASHAAADMTGTAAPAAALTKSDVPETTDAPDARLGLYGGAAWHAYEAGYGLVTLGANDDPAHIVIRWHARPDACPLCAPRDRVMYTMDALPGWPGDGGFGKLATVCRGGPNCRCHLSYVKVTPEQLAAYVVHPAPTNPGDQPLALEGPVPDAIVTAFSGANSAADARAADLRAVRTAMASDDPAAALDTALDEIADRQAEAQRPYLMGLLQDVQANATRRAPTAVPGGFRVPHIPHIPHPGIGTLVAAGVLAAIATQVASQDRAAPATNAGTPPVQKHFNPAELAKHFNELEAATSPKQAGSLALAKHHGHADDVHHVYAYLARHYPASTLDWVKQAHWHGPQQVKLSDIEMGRRPGGRNPDKVAAIAHAVDDGMKLDPIVLVLTPDGLPYRIADGYHRTLALVHCGQRTVNAWIGHVDTDTGPWDTQMHAAKLNKAGAITTTTKVDQGAAGRVRARHLIRWFERGEGAIKIGWGTDGDFDRCVALAAEHMSPGEAKGFCANRHHGALGIWPAEHAALDRAGKQVDPDLIKVGPKGYIHGWIKVGPGLPGDRVEHPELGHGTVTRAGKKTSAVRFDNGHEAAFEHAASGGGQFVPRAKAPRPAGAPRAKGTATAVKPPKGAPDHAAVAAQLLTAGSRDEQERLLKPHLKNGLQGIADHLDVPYTSRHTKADLTASILDKLGEAGTSDKATVPGTIQHYFSGLTMYGVDSSPTLRFGLELTGDPKRGKAPLSSAEVAEHIDAWVNGPEGPIADADRVRAGQAVPTAQYRPQYDTPAKQQLEEGILREQAARWTEVARRLRADSPTGPGEAGHGDGESGPGSAESDGDAASFASRIDGARQGRAVADLPPVQIQVDASSGSDTGRWRATQADGYTGSPRALLTAMTDRVRQSGALANDRLRFPNGRPMEDWEVKHRAGYPADMQAKLAALDAERQTKDAAAGDRHIAAVDKAMAQSQLPTDVVLWRGMGPSTVGIPDGDATGYEWTDPGYVGTSAVKSVATGGFGGRGAVLRILAPSGTRAITIQGGGEEEVLLDRGHRFRVVADRRTPTGGRELDVELLPPVRSEAGHGNGVASKPTFDAADAANDVIRLQHEPDAVVEALQGRNLAQLRAMYREMRYPEPGSRTTRHGDSGYALPAASERATAEQLRAGLLRRLADGQDERPQPNAENIRRLRSLADQVESGRVAGHGDAVPSTPDLTGSSGLPSTPSDIDRQIAEAEARVKTTRERLAKAEAAFDGASRDPKAEALGEFFPLGTGGSGGGRRGSTDTQLRRYVEARKARDAAQSQHVRAEARLRELTARRGAAGKYNRGTVSAGDVIKVKGTWYRVHKANDKTVQIDAGPGMEVKYRWDQVTDHRPITEPASTKVDTPSAPDLTGSSGLSTDPVAAYAQRQVNDVPQS